MGWIVAVVAAACIINILLVATRARQGGHTLLRFDAVECRRLHRRVKELEGEVHSRSLVYAQIVNEFQQAKIQLFEHRDLVARLRRTLQLLEVAGRMGVTKDLPAYVFEEARSLAFPGGSGKEEVTVVEKDVAQRLRGAKA